ncbi:MAG: SRPBCC family protein [Proteobacteria bacterium]|nr:MAG: SRPBCC family protein [Pseudomonadota bacterium]
MSVLIDHEFAVSADVLWEILGTPDRVDWVPGVESCSYDGEVRSLDLPGAGAIKERILNHDNDARVLEYSCFESPGALESHRAKMEITTTESGCRLQWQAHVKPEGIEPFIKGSMEGCIARLEEMLQ